MRRRRAWTLRTLAVLAAGAFISGVASGSGAAGAGDHMRPHPPVIVVPTSASKLLGQRIMVGLHGVRAGRRLLRAIRRGEVGAVILFARNIGSDAQVRALTASLQAAARAGANPPLLIATDQEGGLVKRFPGGPPDRSPPQIVAAGGTGLAYREGAATGAYLRARGITMDLAPVLDVPTFPGAFIWQQGRAFSFSARTVARYATAFADGLQSAGVAAVGKHFPGLGSAAVSTDVALEALHPTRGQRRAALTPYRRAIAQGLDGVLVTTAAFPAYDASGAPAAFSSTVIGGILRGQLHFGGVTITDSLAAPTGHDPVSAGVLAAEAGCDILLFTDSARGELRALRRALSSGALGRTDAAAAYTRIVALKRRLGG